MSHRHRSLSSSSRLLRRKAHPIAIAPILLSATLLLPSAHAIADDGQSGSSASGTGLRSPYKPLAFFVQAGTADRVTSVTGGWVWSLLDERPDSRWSAHLDASLSVWKSRRRTPDDTGSLAQVALIPVFRARLGQSPWFAEVGVGVTFMSHVFRNADTRFSTSFNFGDEIGIGRTFGDASRNEVSLRLEHFSNAGIRNPNPGRTFLQLRYVRRFD
ncbi:MAG TPA: acyloxyacyl hydrolase [Burkholderiaceae bacterium]|nr:acyloxyacyl hydrolase [Burkholderiaceae bacterium]